MASLTYREASSPTSHSPLLENLGSGVDLRTVIYQYTLPSLDFSLSTGWSSVIKQL